MRRMEERMERMERCMEKMLGLLEKGVVRESDVRIKEEETSEESRAFMVSFLIHLLIMIALFIYIYT